MRHKAKWLSLGRTQAVLAVVESGLAMVPFLACSHSISLSALACLLVCLSACLSFSRSVRLSVRPSVCPSVRLSISLSVYLSACLSDCLPSAYLLDFLHSLTQNLELCVPHRGGLCMRLLWPLQLYLCLSALHRSLSPAPSCALLSPISPCVLALSPMLWFLSSCPCPAPLVFFHLFLPSLLAR